MSSIAISGPRTATLPSEGQPPAKSRLRKAAIGGIVALCGACYLSLREQASQEPFDQKPIFDLTTTQEPSFSPPQIDIRRFLASLFPYNVGSLKRYLPQFQPIEPSEKAAQAFPISCFSERFLIFSNTVSESQKQPITTPLLDKEKPIFALTAVPRPSFSFPRMDVRKLLSFIFPFNLGPLTDYLPRLKPIEPYVISPQTFSINCLRERTPIISNLSENITPVKPEPIINNSSQQEIPDSKFDPKSSAALSTLAFIVAQMTQEFYLSPSFAFPQLPLVSPFPSFSFEIFEQAITKNGAAVNPTAVEVLSFVEKYIRQDPTSTFTAASHFNDLQVLAKLSRFKPISMPGQTVANEYTTIDFCLMTIMAQLKQLKSDWAKTILNSRLEAFERAYSGMDVRQQVQVETIRETYFGPKIKKEAMQKIYELMQRQYSRMIQIYESLYPQQGSGGAYQTSQRFIYAARSALISATVALCLFANYAIHHFSQSL